MTLLSTTIVALAILFSLTAFAMEAGGLLQHPWRTLAAVVALLVLALVLLAE